MLEVLRKKLADLLTQSREIVEVAKRDGRDALTEDELSKLTAANTEATALEAQIAQLEAIEKRSADIRNPVTERRTDPAPIATRSTQSQKDEAHRGFAAWAVGPSSKMTTPESAELATRAGFPFQRDEIELSTRDGVSTLTDAAGKYTVASELNSAVEIARKKYGSVTTIARIIPTEKGNPLQFTAVNDTANEGSIVAQAGSDSEGSGPTFERIELGAYKVLTPVIPVTVEALVDSGVNLPSFMGELLGDRAWRKAQGLLTNGNGTTEPKGVVTAANWTQAASGASIDWFDALIDLIHSVDPEYRVGPNVGFMLNDLVVAELRKVRYGADGEFVWQDGGSGGDPSIGGRLLGYPAVINQAMAAPANNAKAVLFGDFSKFLVRIVGGFDLKRFDERFADTDEVGFRGGIRIDSDLLAATGSYPIRGLQLATDYETNG